MLLQQFSHMRLVFPLRSIKRQAPTTEKLSKQERFWQQGRSDGVEDLEEDEGKNAMGKEKGKGRLASSLLPQVRRETQASRPLVCSDPFHSVRLTMQ